MKDTDYVANDARYGRSDFYRYAGNSGVMLGKLSLGLWHNFGADARQAREMLRYAFDHGITYFDTANNYGPPAGSAEETLGMMLKTDFKPYRDELFLATKAGYQMWQGPYGNYGSKKSIIASAEQSLKRLGVQYVDLFYHHRYDPVTPLDETADALALLVRQGKALYVGLANYPPQQLSQMCAKLKARNVPVLMHMTKYNMLLRHNVEGAGGNVANSEGLGVAVSCPLAQGLLTDRYADGIPKDSRAAQEGFLTSERVAETSAAVRALRSIAAKRGEPLAVMALNYVLKNPVVTTAVIGASSVQQLKQNLQVQDAAPLSNAECNAIERALRGEAHLAD